MSHLRVVLTLFVIFVMLSITLCNPIELENNSVEQPPRHSLWKRFVDPSLTYGGVIGGGISKMRTKRQAGEECEKLELCKLHARSQRNFFAAFELYFVNKENARLWDHHAHSIAECQKRFGGYC